MIVRTRLIFQSNELGFRLVPTFFQITPQPGIVYLPQDFELG